MVFEMDFSFGFGLLTIGLAFVLYSLFVCSEHVSNIFAMGLSIVGLAFHFKKILVFFVAFCRILKKRNILFREKLLFFLIVFLSSPVSFCLT